MNMLTEKWVKQGVEQGVKQGVEQGVKQGIEQGVKQGVKQGVEQGIKEGMTKGEALMILKAIEARFGKTSEKLQNYISKINDTIILEGILPLVISSPSLEELERELELP